MFLAFKRSESMGAVITETFGYLPNNPAYADKDGN